MNKNKELKKLTRKKRFNILLTEEEFRFFKELSKIENKPIAEILRNAVDSLYKPKNQDKLLKQMEFLINKQYLKPVQMIKYRSEFFEIS